MRQFNHCLTILILGAAAVWLAACGVGPPATAVSVPAAPAPTSSPVAEDKPAATENVEDSILYFDDIYAADDSLRFGEYLVEKRSKTIWLEDAETNADVTYVVLTRDGKTAAEFEGIRYPLGNDARFCLFPALGRETKQLVIEQETHRQWRHWVVNSAARPKVVYDSIDYGVGGELGAVDIDRDGRYELVQSLLGFWFWDRLSNVDSPFIEIVFAYDPARGKYVPANPQFPEFALRRVAEDIRKAQEIKADSSAPGRDNGKLGAVLKVVLTYLYAGREREAWAFYESEYDLPDKAEMKAKIQTKLRGDKVYRALEK